MMVTVKYTLIILRADNEGEGGTFSTYSLLSRYVSPATRHSKPISSFVKANITRRDPREASLVRMERYLTGDLYGASQHIRSGIENSKFVKS